MSFRTFDWIVLAAVLAVGLVTVAWTKRYMKSVADFLAGSRCAGRYLLLMCTVVPGVCAIGLVAGWEAGYQIGFAASWWGGLSAPIGLILTLSAFVTYRFRQTRAMTLAQFFELRYSRGFRVYAGLLGYLSGVLNYGIFPAITARFLIYFCGIPEYTVPIAGMDLSVTYAVVLLLLTAASLWMTLSGGQVAIIVSNAVLGYGFLIFGLILTAYFLPLINWTQIGQAFQSIPHADTNSMVNPFKTSKVSDFNIWYYLIGAFSGVYGRMSWQGGHAFTTAPKSPHEGRMSGILAQWGVGTLGTIVGFFAVMAFVVMHHPDYAGIAGQAQARLGEITNPAIQKQMTVPIVLGQLLPSGLLGIICASLAMGSVTVQNSYLHSWGSIFIQDVLMPFRKRTYTPQQHIRVLRWSIFGVAAFAYVFSLLFRQTEYILMFFALTGTIFLGGAGSVILGGLYWKRGTSLGAWCAMTVGAILAFGGGVIQQIPFHKTAIEIRAPEARAVTVNDKPAVKQGDVWVYPYAFFRREEWQSIKVKVTTGDGVGTNTVRYAYGAELPRKALTEQGEAKIGDGVQISPPDATLVPIPPGKFIRLYTVIRSINSQWLYFMAMVSAVLSYVIVSLFGRQVVDMDQLLHRGKYAVKSDTAVGDGADLPPRGWRALMGITPEFTRGDRILYFGTMIWSLGWIAVFIVQLVVNLIQVQPDSWWLHFWMYRFYIFLGVAVITTFWIGIGGFRDMVSFIKTLAGLARNDADDGRVVNHHNVGEDTPP